MVLILTYFHTVVCLGTRDIQEQCPTHKEQQTSNGAHSKKKGKKRGNKDNNE